MSAIYGCVCVLSSLSLSLVTQVRAAILLNKPPPLFPITLLYLLILLPTLTSSADVVVAIDNGAFQS